MKKRSASQLAGDVSERAKKAARSFASSPSTSCRVSFFSPGGVDQVGVVSLCVAAFFRLHRDSFALTLDYLFRFSFFLSHSVFTGSALRFAASFPPTNSTCLCLCYALSRRQFFFSCFLCLDDYNFGSVRPCMYVSRLLRNNLRRRTG